LLLGWIGFGLGCAPMTHGVIKRKEKSLIRSLRRAVVRRLRAQGQHRLPLPDARGPSCGSGGRAWGSARVKPKLLGSLELRWQPAVISIPSAPLKPTRFGYPPTPLSLAMAASAAPATSFPSPQAPTRGLVRINTAPVPVGTFPRRVLLRAASESAMVRVLSPAQYCLVHPLPSVLAFLPPPFLLLWFHACVRCLSVASPPRIWRCSVALCSSILSVLVVIVFLFHALPRIIQRTDNPCDVCCQVENTTTNNPSY
jgi:hypothetical protein